MSLSPAHQINGGPWRALLLAGATLLAGLALTLVLCRALQNAEQDSLARYIDNLASHVEADMRSAIGDQLHAQYRMVSRLEFLELQDGGLWRRNAENYLAQHTYYRSLAVLDTDLAVLRMVGHDIDLIETGDPFPPGENYRAILAQAGENGEMVVTRPHYMADGRPGMSFILPMGQGDELLGYLAATMDIPGAVNAMVPARFREEMTLHVSSGGREIYPFPPSGETLAWDADFKVDLDDDQEGFLFEFALSDAIRSQLITRLPDAVALSGVLSSALLAVVVFLGANAYAQTRVLARSNQRLEKEITERKAAESELEFLAHHDELTGLPNRLGISIWLGSQIERHSTAGDQLALLFLDLDQFKDINDSLGHQLGDLLLRELPKRLAGVLRNSDFIGRHGGDEFLIGVRRDDHGQVEQLTENILRALDNGFTVQGHRLFISASIGIAYYPDSGRSVSELIQSADSALFRAKEAGRNQFAVFTREMLSRAQRRLNLSRGIRHALDNGDFHVVYQPIMDVSSRTMVGAEALLRWRLEDGQWVPPQEFIRVAEETGVIGRLGEFVLDHALADLAHWEELSPQAPWLAVNVSGAQIHEEGFAERISVLLHRHRIKPDQLHLEITEEVLIENLTRNRDMLHTLDQIGLQIVVDDFGIGYSSLSYLKNFPISTVKIDRSFIHDLVDDSDDQAITRTICNLAAELGMTTVAEGVESEAQLELLTIFNCSFAQGFLFSRPVKADQIVPMLARPPRQQVEGSPGKNRNKGIKS